MTSPELSISFAREDEGISLPHSDFAASRFRARQSCFNPHEACGGCGRFDVIRRYGPCNSLILRVGGTPHAELVQPSPLLPR
jgi:hypothetical protein